METGLVINYGEDINMADIKMQSVTSSNVAQVGFDETAGVIRIQFNNGGTYDAKGATKADFDAFLLSKSKGQHFNKVLKKAFVWNKTDKKGA